MPTTEQKAWQLHENGVTYGELYMTHQRYAWDFDNLDGIVGLSMDDTIEIVWNGRFVSEKV